MSGVDIPPALRLTVRTDDGTDYCANVGVSSFISLFDLETECWTGLGSQYAGQPISVIQWNVVSNASAAETFNFCITNLQATLTPPPCDCPYANQYCDEFGQCVGSCTGACGFYVGDPALGACNCDGLCFTYGDCCDDICDLGVCDDVLGICI